MFDDRYDDSRSEVRIQVPAPVTTTTRTVSTTVTNFNLVLIGVYQIIEYFNQIPNAPEFI